MKNKPYLRVGVLMGGPSAEREISLKSGKAVSSALREAELSVIEIGEKEEIEAGLRTQKIDIAFIALHGRYGEDGQVQKFLEINDIPYTGSGVRTSRLAMNKIESRPVFQNAGLAVPAYKSYGPAEELIRPPYPFPVVVKPSSEGSSIGLSIVDDPNSFPAAVARARDYDEQIIVERYIPGRELTVSVLEDTPLPIMEIVPQKFYFDFEAKYTKGKSDFILPASLSTAIYRTVSDAGLRAHRSLGCYAYSRIDIILGKDNVPYILEVNTIPGFTETSLFPRSARAAGITFCDLCVRLLDLGWKRARGDEAGAAGSGGPGGRG